MRPNERPSGYVSLFHKTSSIRRVGAGGPFTRQYTIFIQPELPHPIIKKILPRKQQGSCQLKRY